MKTHARFCGDRPLLARASSGLLVLALGMLPGITGCSPAPAAGDLPTPKATVQHPESRELTDFDEFNGWTDASATVEVRVRGALGAQLKPQLSARAAPKASCMSWAARGSSAMSP